MVYHLYSADFQHIKSKKSLQVTKICLTLHRYLTLSDYVIGISTPIGVPIFLSDRVLRM